MDRGIGSLACLAAALALAAGTACGGGGGPGNGPGEDAPAGDAADVAAEAPDADAADDAADDAVDDAVDDAPLDAVPDGPGDLPPAGDATPGDALADAPDDVPPACPVDALPGPGLAVTDRGAVQGTVRDGVAAFLGIPYALPPVGDLRFRPPREPGCRAGTLDATAFAPACLQKDWSAARPGGGATGSEDCLYLNVWAPVDTASPRPVMVFLHGGGNVQGSAREEPVAGVALYDGHDLAAGQGVVVVTVQYRLNLFGFLAHPDLSAGTGYGASGNWGLMDQVQALRWVHRNAPAFGGDPGRVMLFGESAGAVDTCMMILSPLARGLFQAAAMQSGSCPVAPLSRREAEGEEYVSGLGCGQAQDLRACLAALSPEALVAPLQRPFEGGLTGGGGFGPVRDGHVLPREAEAAFAAGDFARVPLILGTNADETAASVAEGSVTPASVAAAFAGFGAWQDDLLAAYPPGATDAEAREAWIRATTDAQFTCPARRVARQFAAGGGGPVFRYLFTHTAPPQYGGDRGAFHGLELFYVFGAVTRIANGLLARPEDRAVAGFMQRAWARLAATGNPAGGADPAWPAWDAARDPWLEIAATPVAGEGVRTAACDLWDAIAGEPG